jgi:hypothetical protein
MLKEQKSKRNYHSDCGRTNKKKTQKLERWDLNVMGIEGKRRALARECWEWRKIVLEAKVDNGL